MNPMTAEWVAKAEGDFVMVEREARARNKPNYDGLCFHAQQCAKKYPNAVLCEQRRTFPRIHFLGNLLDLLVPVVPDWEQYREDLVMLSNFTVAFRYPGESADRETAMDARRRCRIVRRAARATLGVDDTQP